ncbi:MAG TPA: histidine kinase dimerization/phosphoacceptor domain -containing protein [Bacteroidia bacterium]|jgi:two-component sensor histidine kinase|nr:histidine kinase dimerization/phosphoacceptor domain -containing protein [Bacteroidia bacterium]
MSFLNRLLSTSDTRDGLDNSMMNRKLVIHQFTLITLVLTLAGLVNLLFLNEYIPVILCAALSIPLVFSWYQNKKGHQDLGASIVLVVVNIQIFYFTSYFGVQSGIYLFFFPSSMCAAFLFNWKTKRSLFLVHLLFVLILSALLVTPARNLFTGRSLNVFSLSQVLTFDLLVCVSLLIYFIHLVTRTSELRQQELLRYIEERTESEASIRASLKEKETLLAEVHHRVKNNLAVISGLLNLQMHSAKNDYTRNVLLDCKSRVSSMALVHEKLYKSESLAEINLHTYLPDLIREIRHSFEDYEEQVKVKLSVPDVMLTVSEAIPCGLIINELVTNSFKHAFTSKENAEITIAVEQTGKELHIAVSDNGTGMPAQLDPVKAETLGLILIQSLADQVSGRYEFKNTHGTHFSLTFTPKGTPA